MENKETSINDLYETINQKVSSVKSKTPNFKEYETDDENKGEEEENDEDNWECEHCGKAFELNEAGEEEIENQGFIEVKCPHCYKMTTCEYEEDE